VSIADAYVDLHVDGDRVASQIRRIVKSSGVDAEGDSLGKRLGSSMLAGLSSALSSSALQKETQKVQTAFGGIGVAAGGALRLVTVMAPLAASGISVLAGGLTAVLGSLYQAGAAAGSFVGVLGALISGAVTAVIAFRGFGEALKGNEEALAKLAPSARAVVTELRGFRDAAADLRTTVQDAFFANLADDVRVLGETYLPIAKANLTGMATALNGVVAQIMAWAAQPKVAADFGLAMEGNTRIMTILGQAAQPILQGILDLYIALIPSAERLSGGITTLAQKFAEWAARGRESGSIAEFMDKAMDSAQTLIGILTNLGGALHNVFTASAGAGDTLLSKLETLTAKFEAWTGSVAGQNAIKTWAEQGAGALEGVGRVIGALAPVFAALAKPEVFNALIAIIESMADTLAEIMPIVSPIIVAFAGLLTALAPIIGPVLALVAVFKSMMFIAGIINAIISAFRILQTVILVVRGAFILLSLAMAANPIGAIITLVGLLVGALVWFFTQTETGKAIVENVWNAIKAAVQAVSDWFTNTFLPAVQAVWDGIKNGVSGVWDAISNAFNSVVSFLEGIVAWVVEWGGRLLEWLTWPHRMALALLIAIWNWIFEAIRGPAQAIWDFLVTAWQAIYDWIAEKVTAIWTWITEKFEAIRAAVMEKVEAVRSFIREAWQAIATWINERVQAAVGFVRDGFNRLMDLVRGPLNQVKQIVSDAWNNVVSTISGFVGRATDAARSVITGVVNAVKGAASSLVSAGRDMIQGLIDGILGMGARLYSAVMGFIKANVPKPVLSVLGIASPSKLFKEYGTNVVDGLVQGLVGGAGEAARASEYLARQVDVGPFDIGGGSSLSAGRGMGGGNTTYNIEVVLDIERIRDLGTVADFLEMLDRQRVNARRTLRSGTVRAV